MNVKVKVSDFRANDFRIQAKGLVSNTGTRMNVQAEENFLQAFI